MKSALTNDLELAAYCAQYDEHVKRLLAHRMILAWIMKCSIREFSQLTVKYIATECIQGDIEVAQVSVLPANFYSSGEQADDSPKTLPERILGDNTEDKVPGEGTITYDIRFHAAVPSEDKQAIKLLVNLEAQKKFSPGYPLVTRGIFYGARMISAQLDTEFWIPQYQNLKKVYSIWICMNAPKYIGNALTEYRITKHDRIRAIPSKESSYDKLSVVLIALNRNHDYGDGIFRLLNTLLSETMDVDEKMNILESEYQIPATISNYGEEMTHMCNLSELILERGLTQGISALIETCQEVGLSKEATLTKLMNKFSLSAEESEVQLAKYWN